MKKMKFIYKVWVSMLIIGFISACDLDLLDNPNAVTPDNASIELLMNNAFIEFANLMVGESAYYDGINDLAGPFVRMLAMQGSKVYANADGPESYDFLWQQAYATVLPDLQLVIDRATTDGSTRYSGVAKILEAFVLFSLVDMFGDIPYSDALQGTDNLSPALDDDEAVYTAALDLLNSAITDLSDAKGATLANDLYYGGDVSKWLRLANTLKLRYYLNTRFVNPNALAEINTLANSGNIISVTADDWEYHYGSNREAPDSRHPFYTDAYEDGGPGQYMSNYRMWAMFGEKNVEDPRIRYYFYRQDCDETDEDFFTLQCQAQPYPFHWPAGYPYCTASSDWGDPGHEYGGYWGRDHGDDSGIPPDDLKRTAWGIYPAGGKFDGNNCSHVSNLGTDGLKGAGILPLVNAANVHFMIAEANLAGGNAAGARTSMEAGVRESIAKVMAFGASDAGSSTFIPSAGQIENYVTEVLSLYDAAANDDARMNVIMKEAWLAMQSQGLEAYNAYRRTCKPEGMQLSLEANPGNFPRTLWYPANFVNRNENVDQKANLDVKVFWDANPSGCVLQ